MVDDAHARDRAGVREPRPEHPRLLVGALGELGARDAPRESEVVADQRARARLSADRLALEHERVESLGCRVHRRGQAGGPRPDDGEIDDAVGQRGLEAVGAGELRVVGIDEHAAVGRAHERHARVLDAGGGEHRCRIGRRRVEVIAGHPASGEAAAQHVRARLRVVADHREAAMALARRCLPLAQEVGDRSMERLVGGVHRPHHVVVDLHPRHELQDRVGRRPVGPGSPLDDEAPPHVGKGAACRGEHAVVTADRRRVVGQHERHALAVGRGQLVDRRDRAGGAVGLDDPVVLGVPPPERHEQRPAHSLVGRGHQDHGRPSRRCTSVHSIPSQPHGGRRGGRHAASVPPCRRGLPAGRCARPVMGIYTRMSRGTDFIA